MLPNLLAVDDEQSSLNAIKRTLRRDFNITLAKNGHAALEAMRTNEFAVILADQRMPEMTGVEFFKKAIERQPAAMRILITGYSDAEAMIHAINEGQIFYYVHKPWEPDELSLIVHRAADQYRLMSENAHLLEELADANKRLTEENTILHKEVEKNYSFENIIGDSPAINRVFTLLKKAIPTPITVMLMGETGTGKELIARSIHYNGPRQNKVFMAQNCGALPETLLESQLFGHVKGAFTGASADKKGIFEIADGGTVFLDEVADTSLAMQQRLLRVLQEGEITPVGSEKTMNVDVRIVSAANRDLEEEIKAGKFREDLYYRLNVFPIRIPPLRERREDISLLANFFMEKYARKLGKTNVTLAPATVSELMTLDFPGNVRQLENIMERAVTLTDDDGNVTPDLLLIDGLTRSKAPVIPTMPDENDERSLKEIVDELESVYIIRTLGAMKGNISRAAEKLGLSRLGLHKKMQRFGIDASNYKQS
ncbi:MAG: sigma-54-dependent transcriptional regulator [Calditrichia bacterium]